MKRFIISYKKILFLNWVLLFLFLISFFPHELFSQDNSSHENYIGFTASQADFAIVSNGNAIPVVVDKEEFPGVIKIAKIFQQDIKEVTDIEPALNIGTLPKNKQLIIVGTLEKSSLINKLINSGKLDVKDIKDKWENSLIQIINNPFKGVDKAMVIVGSDKRGAIFGMFDISRKIGISPWHFWSDVPAKKHEEIYVKEGRYNLGEPKVKYRGIFLNDEEPALGRWAVQNYGGFTHQFYEKIFELILRLKGNYLWPAMWWASFNSDDPLNPKLADEMGIVMSTSHHEPMMRAHAEWTPYRENGEKWNFALNPEGLKKFWREGIQRMGNCESVVTLAMRGDGDEAMEKDANISLLENIVKEQRKIIAEVTGKPSEQIPQVWALYKEVQDYYDKGMTVPDDVTLLLCDDNWGDIRILPKLADPKRSGGYGMYYHFDFVGGPRNYKWLNTSPLPKVWDQMHLCYKYGVNRIWIVNVGDLKPMELPVSFFLDYAWNPENFPAEKLNEYTVSWAKEQFGMEHAGEIAEILRLYTKYNGRRKPESLYFDTYSISNFREFERIVNDYKGLVLKAQKLYEKIDNNQKDAFYQLVLHPVIACSNLNELYYSTALNYLYAKQGRAATNEMAKKVEELFKKDADITKYYHTELANGKWNHMMAQTHIGYTYWQEPPVNSMPKLKKIKLEKESKMALTIEGDENIWPNEQLKALLPQFDSYNKQEFYIEIFNKGETSFKYEIKSSQPWVILSQIEGLVDKQVRVNISIDWEKLNPAKHHAQIEIKSEKGEKIVVEINALKFDEQGIRPKGFIENNGFVSMEAPNYTKATNSEDINWLTIPGMGKTVAAVTGVPVTKSIEKVEEGGPVLEYKFFLFETPKDGKIKVNIFLSPTLNFQRGKGLHYGVSIDNEKPQLINMHEGFDIPDWEYPDWWNQAVLNNIIVKTSEHVIPESGEHVLKFWRIDPGIVLQKIVIDNGGLKPSYLGPPESIILK